ncbi:TonB family protein [Hymenobacter convexus]|uniref:TonB family protein n=1 Tax=Hymenobacter sp. CA1UV-4 TaxID=3063782 RepID=UPI002713EEF3|nr:TonB family protein [Hymenobacter sp. CA1UV-4]MDO7850355.1 TonB family protein [Hymenobacter sp. CA1UV-4]
MAHRWLILLTATLAAGLARGQTPKAVAAPPVTNVYTYVEQMPQPPGGGGNAAMVALIQKAIHIPLFHGNYPESSRVVVGFTVTEAGQVRGVRIHKSIDRRVDSAVVHAVRALPRFTPGRQQGRAVSVSFRIPITFCWQ